MLDDERRSQLALGPPAVPARDLTSRAPYRIHKVPQKVFQFLVGQQFYQAIHRTGFPTRGEILLETLGLVRQPFADFGPDLESTLASGARTQRLVRGQDRLHLFVQTLVQLPKLDNLVLGERTPFDDYVPDIACGYGDLVYWSCHR